MSADTLTVSSRDFYERTKGKVAASIIFAAGSLITLGMCSVNGGLSKSNQIEADVDGVTGDAEDAFTALAQGYGFAAFFDIVACLLLLVAAIFISPLIFGSPHEKKIIRNPQEIDNSYSAYEEEASATGSQV